jgi:hypothetical protein
MMWHRPVEDTLDYVAEHGFNINGTTYSFEDCVALARVAHGALVPDRLANHPDPRVRLPLAHNADSVVARYLMEDPDPDVRAAAMSNPNVSVGDLEIMASYSSPASRAAAAAHPRIIEATSHKIRVNGRLTVLLALDSDAAVLQALAANSTVPAANKKVTEALASNNDPTVRAAVASNPSLPVNMLAALADDDEFEPRHSAYFNPATPQHIREHLAVEFG